MNLTELKKQFVSLALDCISEKPHSQKKPQIDDLYRLAVLISEQLGFEVNELKELQEAKRKKNGGFQKRYVLHEKVLPIEEGILSNKVLRDDSRDTKSGAQKTIAETTLAGVRPIPEKLVRDNIPTMIEKQARKNAVLLKKKGAIKLAQSLDNYHAKVRIASLQEFPKLLIDKLSEESNEFLAAIEPEDQLEDLADILEIVEAWI